VIGHSPASSDVDSLFGEFGPVQLECIDIWTFVVSAGFQDVKINTVGFPDATAISARK
jgi:hypothetical protein